LKQLNNKNIDPKQPQSPEAEVALLGSVFFDPSIIAEITDVVGPKDFYIPANQAVAQVIWGFFGESKPIDPALVYDELCTRKQDAVVGGHEGLYKLADAMPESSHAPQYAKIVADKAKLRNLMTTCRAAIMQALDGSEDADTIIDKTHDSIYRLAAEKQRGGVLEYHQGMGEELKRIKTGEGERHAVWTGFADIDKLTGGLHDGELTYLAAYPRMGKTTMALNIMEHLALKQDKRSVIFTLEVPKRQILINLTAIGARVPVSKFRTNTLTPEDIDKMEAAYSKIEKNIIWVTGQPKNHLEMKAIIRQIDAKFGISLVVVDYIQLLLKTLDKRAGEMSLISRQMKLIAQELDKPFLVLSQFNRPKAGKEAKMPVLSQLKESGSLEQDADAVFLLHRLDPLKEEGEPKDRLARLHVAKQKNGPQGFVKLCFFDDILRFENFANSDKEEPIKLPPKKEPPKKMFIKEHEEERLPYKDAPEKPEVTEGGFKKSDDGAPIWGDDDDEPF